MKKKVLGTLFAVVIMTLALTFCHCNNSGGNTNDGTEKVYPADSTVKDSVKVQDTVRNSYESKQ
jgi:hypothetical protein